MNEGVTADNIETVFATNINNSPENVKYALYVDGMRATGYDFIIDTDENALAQRSLIFNQNLMFFDGMPYYMPLEYEFNKPIEILYADGSVYDYKVELTTGDEDEAEARGVEIGADGKSIIVKPTTTGKTPSNAQFGLWVSMIDVNGNTVDRKEVTIQFANKEMANIRLNTVDYTVTSSEDANAKNLIIELVKDGKYIFEELTADQVDNNLSAIWSFVTPSSEFITTSLSGIKYYATLDAAKKFGNDNIDLTDPSGKQKARQIKYAVIPVPTYNTNAQPTDGDPYELKLTLNVGPSATAEVKEITVPVDVQLPTWADLFQQNNTTAMWENNTFKSRLSVDMTWGTAAAIALNGAYIHTTTAPDADVAETYVIGAEYYDATTGELVEGSNPLRPGTYGAGYQLGTNNVKLTYSDLTQNTATTGKLEYNKLQVEVGYRVAGVAGFEITNKFDVQLMSLFEGAELVWYTGLNTTGDTASLNGTDNIIMSGHGSNADDKGLALRFIGDSKDADNDATAGSEGIFGGGATISAAGYKLTTSRVSIMNVTEVQYELSASVVNGTSCTVDETSTGLQINSSNPIEVGEGGTLKATFTDAMGVKTEATIPFVKINGKLK